MLRTTILKYRGSKTKSFEGRVSTSASCDSRKPPEEHVTFRSALDSLPSGNPSPKQNLESAKTMPLLIATESQESEKSSRYVMT